MIYLISLSGICIRQTLLDELIWFENLWLQWNRNVSDISTNSICYCR